MNKPTPIMEVMFVGSPTGPLLEEPEVTFLEAADEIESLKARIAYLEANWRPKKQVSDETRAKIAAARTGQKHSEEVRKKMGDSKRGKSRPAFTDEWRANLSASRKAHFEKKKKAEQES